jgi:phenylpropionate dioxygenase-like ring-hydroxylating dioxygenase large terminal subunit
MSKQKKDSDDLLRVDAGAPMGEMMRQYWIPALMSSELERDGAPLRLMLLGERLVAFRDSSGRVGVMDHRCPHRCASLFLGRNEENGIRCVYHGWKYDAEGNCVDMPNAPPHQDFKDKVKAKAYKVAERNGLVWVYMGARKEAPPLPEIEASLLPEAELQISFVQRECNWLQALEGDIDTSHFGFLHTGSVQPDDAAPDSLLRWTVVNRAPEYHMTDTPYGTMYCAYREAEKGQKYWRFANFLFPFWTQTPQGPFDRVNTRAWVPMDDTHTMFVSLSWRGSPPSMRPLKNGQLVPGSRLGFDYLPNTTDWYGRWRLTQNPSNDWMIDRAAQKTESYTGIASIHGQDQAVTESMGAITDHEFENLGPSDIMIARTRRRLLRAARAFAKDGTVPPCVDEPGIYTAVRSGDFLADTKIAWRDAYELQMGAAMRPLAQAAE